MMPEHALKAYTALDGQIFMGRILEVLPGRDKLVLGLGEQDEDGMTFKQRREKQRKEEAGNAFTWNTLFMNVSIVGLDVFSGELQGIVSNAEKVAFMFCSS